MPRSINSTILSRIWSAKWRKSTLFTFLSLDGYFQIPNRDISWHRHAQEEDEYSAQSLTLMFGRVTYGMMASYWPTPLAIEQNPSVAESMNLAKERSVAS